MQTRQTPYQLSRVPTPNIISLTVGVGLRVTSATRKVAQLEKQQGRRQEDRGTEGKDGKKGGRDEGRAAEKQKVWFWLSLFV